MNKFLIAAAMAAGLVTVAHAQDSGVTVSTDPAKAAAIEQRAQELRASQHPAKAAHEMKAGTHHAGHHKAAKKAEKAEKAKK